MILKSILSALLVLVFFGGCAKELEEYNKPAAYWYAKMIASISDGNIEKADNYYSSLQSEHIGSPLLPEATMILAQAHMYYEEYLLSEHFLNEYIKRFADPRQKEYAEFLKIRAKYMALPNPRRDQGLIDSAIEEGESFKMRYPNSMYFPVVDSMVTRLYLAQASLNETIALLYDRLDKPNGAVYYRGIKPQPWIDWAKVEKADVAWYRAIFEGDGTESWYAFLVPDTQSVVSRSHESEIRAQEPRRQRSNREISEEKRELLNPSQPGM